MLVAFFSYSLFIFFQKPKRTLDFTSEKIITINDNGLLFQTTTSTTSIAAFLEVSAISLSDYDVIFPVKETQLYPSMQIIINRAVAYQLRVDDQLLENYSTAKTIGGILAENKVTLGRLDKISPALNAQPHADEEIIVTRINIEEKIITEDIPFETIRKQDAKLGWREEKTEQKGVEGKIAINYRITYKNGKEISRVVLEKNILQEPTPEIITRGTYMKLGKAATGQGTWYAFKGGLFAASTSLPMGSYARVTNLANGKSVVVQINDYGPQGKGRIIDLDKVAFTSIASLGVGVIGVKVEAVLN